MRIDVAMWIIAALLFFVAHPAGAADASPQLAALNDNDNDNDTDVVAPATSPSEPVDTDSGLNVAEGIPSEKLPSYEFSLEPAEISVGQVAQWQVVLERAAGDRVHLPSEADFGGLEVQSKERGIVEERGEAVRERMAIQLIAFESGDFDVPPQRLTVVDANGRIGELEIPGGLVSVKSLIANEPEPGLKEDLGPGEEVIEKDYTLLWILGVLVAAGLGGLIALLVRRLWARRRPKSEPPPPPPRPAEEIALEKLQALRESDLLERGEFKDFHVRLSEGVREYLGNRYRFDSLELSSEELVQRVRSVRVEQVLYSLILDFLAETDLVKFAKMVPTLDESQQMLEAGFHLVRETTPVVEVNPDAPAAPIAGQEGRS